MGLPVGLAVVAADNDQGTEVRIGTNPGIDAAQAAADAAGAGVAVPVDMPAPSTRLCWFMRYGRYSTA